MTDVAEHVDIRDLRPYMLPAITRIADAAFGEDYFSRSVGEHLDGRTSTDFRVAVHENRGIVGFCYTKRLSGTEMESSIDFALEDVSPNDEVAVLKTIAVRKGSRGQGIGRQLVDDMLSQARADGQDYATCIAWRDSGDESVSIAPLLQRTGFTRINEISEYWRVESVDGRLICPACGPPPCRCNAVIYAREVD